MKTKAKNIVAGIAGADPTLPNVSLTLGGKSYQLCYDFNAVVVAEKETGGINLLSSVVGEVSACSLRGLLFASLLKENPDITIAEVGAMIRPTNIAEIRTAVFETWFGSVADKDESEGEGQEAPKA